MRRRTLLAAVAATGASAAAGCLDAGPTGDSDGDAAGDPATSDGSAGDGSAGGDSAGGDTTTDDATTDDTTGDDTTGDDTTAETTTDDTAGDDTAGDDATDETTDDSTTDDGGAGSDDGSDDTTDETTERSGLELVDSTFEVASVECGSSAPRASVAFPTENSVRVTGVARGRNGCFTAELRDVSVDQSERSMVVDVTTYEPDHEGVCTQCIVDVAYEATFTFDDGRPKRVVVEHDGREVADGPEAH